MKKKIISAVLLIVFCFSFAVSAAAAEPAEYVIDDFGVLTSEEIAGLNDLAGNIYRETGVGIFYVYTWDEELGSYDVASLVNGVEDYVIMTENETSWLVITHGQGDIVDAEAAHWLRDVYDATDTYIAGVEDFICAAAEYFAPATTTVEASHLPEMTGSGEYLLFDEADLLTDGEETVLTGKLNSLSKKYNAQLIVATIASLDGADIDEFVNYLYDSMGFGYGENHDGVLLLVSMDPRQYRILSNGFAGDAIGSGKIEKIGDAFRSDLSAGNYAAAFGTFADECGYYLDGHINGYPFNFGRNILVCLIIGIVAGVVVALVLKGQLKTVRKQNQAHNYIRSGSMNVSVRNDVFLYRDVTKTKKASSSSSSGSSGGSRSTGGGSF